MVATLDYFIINKDTWDEFYKMYGADCIIKQSNS